MIDFVFHYKFSAVLVVKILPNFTAVQRLPTSLQNQYPGDSSKVAGVATPNSVTEFRTHFTLLREVSHLLTF